MAACAAEARRGHPWLPVGLGGPAGVAGLLAGCLGNGLGVAAVQGDRVRGFLAPLTFDLWGGPAAYVAEWGQAVAAPDLVAPLYAAASARWGEAGRAVHAVTLWAHQSETEAAWHDLGFGRVVIDAARPVVSPPRRSGAMTVRPAGRRDAFTLAALEGALWEHLAAPPVSRVHPSPGGRAAAARRLADPAQPVWLVEVEGAAVGFLSLQPGDDSPALLRSPYLVRCDGAFVLPGSRGRGGGRALLAAALRWAAGAGFAGCTVDYESANLPAVRFWTRAGFSPVLHSVGRRLC